ncbi:tape measure protein, partial [Patescibacteria group bacterium]|nr:tape measure protein [Patescibacteria group bacterium]
MGSRNGLQQVSDSAKSFNLGPVSTAVEGVSTKFLALATIGITVLSNLTNKAVDAGLRMAKALSFEQVLGGFKEYELQISSIQTILANTSAEGTSLSQVSAALDELNTYADQTIYNFAEMTRNIGTFTAAGVGLDLSVQSIKGIANLAAISGSNSQQASTAMYQLSQAISTGSVKLMDWNSVVNAGMGGKVFQTALFETGKMMGEIADVPMGMTFEEWTDAGNTFRGSLEQGWLTADVLTTTLQGFTGELTEAQILSMGYTQAQAQEIMRLGQLGVDSATKVRTLTQLMQTVKESISSGWASSFRVIFGDFDQATELFTNISNSIGEMVGKSADARNELLQGWADLGGRTVLIEAFTNVWKALGSVLGPIKDAFRDIFPAQTAETLFALTEKFRDFTERLILGGDTMDAIRANFRGFFAVLEIGWTVIKEGIGFFVDLFKSVTGAGSGKFLAFTTSIGDFFTSLNEKLVAGGAIKDFFDKLGSG